MNEVEMSLERLKDGAPTIAAFERKIDSLVYAMLEHGELVDEDLTHRFVGGIYIRELRLPAGTVGVSLIHKTENPFVIQAGRVLTFSPAGGVVELCAGDSGVSEPGQRRVGVVLEDLVWTSFHPCENGETVEELEARLYDDMVLPNGNTLRQEWKARLANRLEASDERNRNGRSCGDHGGWKRLRGEQAEEGCGKRAEGREQASVGLHGVPREDEERARPDAGVEPRAVRHR